MLKINKLVLTLTFLFLSSSSFGSNQVFNKKLPSPSEITDSIKFKYFKRIEGSWKIKNIFLDRHYDIDFFDVSKSESILNEVTGNNKDFDSSFTFENHKINVCNQSFEIESASSSDFICAPDDSDFIHYKIDKFSGELILFASIELMAKNFPYINYLLNDPRKEYCGYIAIILSKD